MLSLGVHLLHHVRGPAVDYLGVGLAAFVSWAGLPGPGESVLIAAGVIASKHKLDVSPVVVAAWIGATVGGVVGWIFGLKAGRTLVTAPGPLRRARLNAVARGEQLFRRFEVIAILLVPSWVAGIHGSRAPVYLVTNGLSAATWAAGIGLGAFYAGPTVLDLLNDAGTVITVLVVALVIGGVTAALLGRTRRRTRERNRRRGEPG